MSWVPSLGLVGVLATAVSCGDGAQADAGLGEDGSTIGACTEWEVDAVETGLSNVWNIASDFQDRSLVIGTGATGPQLVQLDENGSREWGLELRDVMYFQGARPLIAFADGRVLAEARKSGFGNGVVSVDPSGSEEWFHETQWTMPGAAVPTILTAVSGGVAWVTTEPQGDIWISTLDPDGAVLDTWMFFGTSVDWALAGPEGLMTMENRDAGLSVTVHDADDGPWPWGVVAVPEFNVLVWAQYVPTRNEFYFLFFRGRQLSVVSYSAETRSEQWRQTLDAVADDPQQLESIAVGPAGELALKVGHQLLMITHEGSEPLVLEQPEAVTAFAFDGAGLVVWEEETGRIRRMCLE